MRIGLQYDFSNPPQWRRDPVALYRRQLEQIAWAEGLGIHAIWLTEHHFWEDDYLPSMLPVASAIAARTSRVAIGTAVLLPLLFHPVRLAEELALVDILSGGRLEVGLGLGWAAKEFAAFGVNPKTRFSRYQEAVDILIRSWRDEDLVFKGKHFTIGPINVTPKPVQRPHPPIWGGAISPAGGRRVGRSCFPLQWMEPPVVEAYLEGRKEAGLPAGPDDYKVGGFLWMFVCDDPDAAWTTLRPHLSYALARYAFGGSAIGEDPRFAEIKTRDDARKKADYYLLSPGEAIAELKGRAATISIENFCCFANLPGAPQDLCDRNVELLATVVAPALANVGVKAA